MSRGDAAVVELANAPRGSLRLAAMTERDELARAVDDANPLTALVNSLIDIALGALREWAQLRGTTVEECLMELLDDG